MSKKDNNDISNKELLDVISKSFDSVEKRFDSVEKKIQDNREAIKNNREEIQKNRDGIESLGQKIQGVRNSLDAEILRYTDQHADHEERITALEERVEA